MLRARHWPIPRTGGGTQTKRSHAAWQQRARAVHRRSRDECHTHWECPCPAPPKLCSTLEPVCIIPLHVYSTRSKARHREMNEGVGYDMIACGRKTSTMNIRVFTRKEEKA